MLLIWCVCVGGGGGGGSNLTIKPVLSVFARCVVILVQERYLDHS